MISNVKNMANLILICDQASASSDSKKAGISLKQTFGQRRMQFFGVSSLRGLGQTSLLDTFLTSINGLKIEALAFGGCPSRNLTPGFLNFSLLTICRLSHKPQAISRQPRSCGFYPTVIELYCCYEQNTAMLEI